MPFHSQTQCLPRSFTVSLHRLSSVTIGVPDVAAAASYYEEFGLSQVAPGRFTSGDGGEQLRLEHARVRRLLGVEIGGDDYDDLARVGTAWPTSA
jgi:catechol 2,3-dioxygenase-like lactoylglutathione lyase family enzyme